jgi:hypothetical protein
MANMVDVPTYCGRYYISNDWKASLELSAITA